MKFRKPELIPLLFIICAVTLSTILGMWQLQRLAWKQNVIAEVEASQQLPILGNLPQDLQGLEYHKVALAGRFHHDKMMHLVGHIQNEGNGFFVLTPFTLDDDGRTILINRGFSPEGQESKPEGMQTVTGLIRPSREKRLFSPRNRPEKNIWFYEDMPAMAQATGLSLTPLVVEAVGVRERNVYPIPSDGKVWFRNDHLNYAITWFAIAIIGVVMFGFYYREKQ